MPALRTFLALTAAAALLLPAVAADNDLIPPQLAKEQRDNLQRFLKDHAKAEHFVPPEAKVVGQPPGAEPPAVQEKPGQTFKQYLAQVLPHRPVPGQEDVQRVYVSYYRPHPERGKPGITVRYTVDLTTGKPVGQPEVLLNANTPMAREEVAEAVELAKEKSAEVKALYEGRDKSQVRYEYLQITIRAKHEPHEPGDRVVTLLFIANGEKDQEPPAPVRVTVNLTKGVVLPGVR